MASGRVLVVDDDPSITKFLKLNLETQLVIAPADVPGVLALALVLALVLGFWGSWRALGAKAAPFLRNE